MVDLFIEIYRIRAVLKSFPGGSEITFAHSSSSYLLVTYRSRSSKSQPSVIDWSHSSKIIYLTSDNVQFGNKLVTKF